MSVSPDAELGLGMQACQLFAQQLLEKCPFNLSTEIDLTYLYSKEEKNVDIECSYSWVGICLQTVFEKV